MTEPQPEIGDIIEGPFESNRGYDSWCWERPDDCGDLGYNRPEILLRCARIFGGRVKVYRTVTHQTTTVYEVHSSPAGGDDRG